MPCPLTWLSVWCMPLTYASTDTFRWSPSVTIYASQITAVHPQLSPRCVQWRGICRSKTSGKPIFTICPMSRATSSTRSVIITKSLVPRISWACCASCTLMAPSSLTLELLGREHNNCTPWAQNTVDPQFRPLRNYTLGLFIQRMGSSIHTGQVVVDEPGDSAHGAPTVSGVMLSVAKRLHERATPDIVVISADTYHLVQGYFTCEVFETPRSPSN